MALFRVDTSCFPRQYEVQTRCPMTVLWDMSGNDVALSNELSETPVLEEYTFLRLTSYSFLDSQTYLIPFGSPGCSLACDWAVTETACNGFYLSTPATVGGCSDQRRYDVEVQYTYAPKEPKLVPSWSTTTLVDTAGWTHVVIQGGQQVLFDVNKGQSMAMVNTSINDVLGADLCGQLRLFWLDGGISNNDALGRQGFRKMNNISISCPSFNEVTI